MDQEPGLSDEVVMISVNSEIVNGLLMRGRRNSNHAPPIPLGGLDEVADAHLSCGYPGSKIGVAASHPERMIRCRS